MSESSTYTRGRVVKVAAGLESTGDLHRWWHDSRLHTTSRALTASHGVRRWKSHCVRAPDRLTEGATSAGSSGPGALSRVGLSRSDCL